MDRLKPKVGNTFPSVRFLMEPLNKMFFTRAVAASTRGLVLLLDGVIHASLVCLSIFSARWHNIPGSWG